MTFNEKTYQMSMSQYDWGTPIILEQLRKRFRCENW